MSSDKFYDIGDYTGRFRGTNQEKKQYTFLTTMPKAADKYTGIRTPSQKTRTKHNKEINDCSVYYTSLPADAYLLLCYANADF